LHSLSSGHVGIRNINAERLLEGDDQLNRVQAVGAKVIDQGSLRDNYARINAKMATDDQHNLRGNIRQTLSLLSRATSQVLNIIHLGGTSTNYYASFSVECTAAGRHCEATSVNDPSLIANGRTKSGVNSVHPGVVDTPLVRPGPLGSVSGKARRDATPLGRFGKPSDIALGCLYLASNDVAGVTGSELVIDGGKTAN
jgi:hypothetical protein